MQERTGSEDVKKRSMRVCMLGFGTGTVFGLAGVVPVWAAGEEITNTIQKLTSWVQGILIAVAILVFVLGVAFYMVEATTGGRERGKQLMVASLAGVVLGLLAGPIVNLAVSFTH
jgi:hypothetical protein